ncbi:MAG: Mov34/MPN/PAD-1 family protein [Methanomassiliicoccales archaeon]|nr:Mov34/MPN/PAD-1 family protein [Methanomassiliicoccales archaeon]
MTEGKRRKIWGIEQDVLDMINEAAKDTYPDEFLATLRAEKGIVTEILLLPGTLSGEHSGTFHLHMLPIDLSVVGTVHSHPSFSNMPSEADISLFGRFGNTHIITCIPFDKRSWKAYDYNGDEIELEVV